MTDKPIHVTGCCLCGEVRYEAEVLLKSGFICHCRVCQKSTGQPSEITVPIKAGTLIFVKGEPKFYVSSADCQRGFCADCGSRIVAQALDPANDWLTNLTVGSLDNSAAVSVECHIFVDTQLPWYQLNESLPRFKEGEVGALFEQWNIARS
ncbi:MAG: hypothetical protein ACI945_000884 [Pseudohongiellaceae bacterium]|jgi:hypothetical protein